MKKKKDLELFIEQNLQELCKISDEIFDHPEMGFEERLAAKLLTDWLEKNGYEVERGVGGLKTAFRAVYENGAGGPSIGLLCEYDALQMGHACGHHMQGPVMLLAAEAIKELITEIPYKLVIYGTPAEEGPQGKRIMMENGCFQDLDISLMTHAAPNTTVDIKSYSGARLEYTFKGVAGNPALMPEKVRSATDALVLAMQGIEFLRGHVKEDVKFYTYIINCEGTPNNEDHTIAKGAVAIRTYENQDMPELEERVKAVIMGAAMMTGTTAEVVKTESIVGKLPSYSLNKIIMDNAALLEAPQQLAYRTRTGCTDFAYVTRMMPGAVSRFAFVPEGSASHSQVFLDHGKDENAHQGIKLGAELIAYTAYDLLTDPSLLKQAQEEYKRRKAQESRE